MSMMLVLILKLLRRLCRYLLYKQEEKLVIFTEDREYFNSPFVYRGSTPKGEGSWLAVNLYISSKCFIVYSLFVHKVLSYH